MFSFGAIGMACKYLVFYGHWVFFPWWPNIADSVVIIIAALLLLYYKFDKSGQPKK
jgi:putative flippase GtrA